MSIKRKNVVNKIWNFLSLDEIQEIYKTNNDVYIDKCYSRINKEEIDDLRVRKMFRDEFELRDDDGYYTLAYDKALLVSEILSTLSNFEKKILVGYYIYGLTLNELSKKLNIPKSTLWDKKIILLNRIRKDYAKKNKEGQKSLS